jgi:hypothetical protein
MQKTNMDACARMGVGDELEIAFHHKFGGGRRERAREPEITQLPNKLSAIDRRWQSKQLSLPEF